MMRCENVRQIVGRASEILFDQLKCSDDTSAEYFFRGESMNFLRKDEGFALPLGTNFPCSLDREERFWRNERELYQESLRLNVVSFEEDRSMVDRVARMQHYLLPTRFCDLTTNVLVAAMFACGGGDADLSKRNNGHDGYIRVMKVRRDRMKSFTSDIINAIAHLPLVDCENVNPENSPDGLDCLRYEITNSRPGFSTDVAMLDGTGIMQAKAKLCEEIQHVWAFKPIWNTRRIRNQFGAFLAFGCHNGKRPLSPSFSLKDYDDPSAPSYGIAQVAVIQIDGSKKISIQDELRYFGMPLENLYPDISNVCQEISNRVK